ncbi:hypothetical protein V5279_28950 [Bradyrhizobium sp. 26S5]|uniref:hypothetical protein n=1 Tax=Bradyrhizobium sp. 26S5 TaxID=3139729 RepID=UPI0030D46F28
MTIYASCYSADVTDGLLPGAAICGRGDDEAKTLQYFTAEPSQDGQAWVVHEWLKRVKGKEVGRFPDLDAIEAWLRCPPEQKVLPSSWSDTGELSAT